MPKSTKTVVAAVLAAAGLGLAGCGAYQSAPASTGARTGAATGAQTGASISTILAQRMNDHLTGMLNTQYPDGDIFAKDLEAKISRPGGDPNLFLLDIRKPKDYKAGHIPGAVNIYFHDLGQPANLAKLPKNKEIVVICYTGTTANQTNGMLNLLGYHAIALKYGMSGWNQRNYKMVDKSQVVNYPEVTG